MKRINLILFIFILTISLMGCSTNVKKVVNDEKDQARILRIDEQNLGYPSVYTVSSRGRGYLLMSFIFDTLTWKDENGVVPMLAKDWTVSDDKQQWTFNLVDNAKFTDGTKLTAEDIKF